MISTSTAAAKKFKSFCWPLLAILLAAGLVRLCFLDGGFGRDPDSWRIAEAGYHIASTGKYFMSRMPGHPVEEYVASLVFSLGGNYYCLNGITAILSLILGLVFYVYWSSSFNDDALIATGRTISASRIRNIAR